MQAALAGRAPGKSGTWEKPIFLLAGLLMCGTCGKKYMVQGGKNNRYYYYVCSTLLQYGAGTCQSKYFNTGAMDRAFVTQFTEQLSSPTVVSGLAVSSSTEVTTSATTFGDVLSQVQDSIHGLHGYLEGNAGFVLSRPIPPDSKLNELSYVRSQLEQLTLLQEEVARSRQRIDHVASFYAKDGQIQALAAMVQELQEVMVDGDARQKRDVIDLLVSQVVIDARGRIDIQTTFPLT